VAVDVSVFKTAEPYRALKESDWEALAGMLRGVDLASGKTLFREGDPGDGFYLIRSGKVKIRRMVDPPATEAATSKGRLQEQLLTILSSGQLFGEMALVDGAPRSADAVAAEDTVLYHLHQNGYEDLKEKHPDTALRIQDLVVKTLCHRLREANRSIEIIQFWLT
jgi:CRP/FNR family cyclic AMP-dependent transcriptional regulator